MISRVWQDIRFGVRMLFRKPMLSLFAIVTFGLGVSLATTVFSIVNGACFKGLPFEDSRRIVVLWSTNPARNMLDMPMSIHDYAIFKERQTTFEDIGFFSVAAMNLAGDSGQPERYTGAQISANSFDILRTKPVLGRAFRAGEGRVGADPVLLISYSTWRDRFGMSTEILGKRVRVNGMVRTIVGVMPKGFGFPGFESLWIPLDVDSAATSRGQGPSYQVFGRIKRGVSTKQAEAQAIAIAAELEKKFPETNRGISAAIQPYAQNFMRPQLFALLYTMLGAGIGILLIACVNVGNLLLARTSQRGREFAIRIAVGASRFRVITQLLAEALLLSLAGGLLGFGLSVAAIQWFNDVLAALNPPPFWITFDLDYRVFLFVTAITLGAGLLAGMVPALQTRKMSLLLKDESRVSKGLRVVRFSNCLIIAEVAISCALLIAAGLMIQSIVNLKRVKMPFAIDNVFTARIHLPLQSYPDAASWFHFYGQLLPRLQGVSGVEAVAVSDGLPASANRTAYFQVMGKEYPKDRNPAARAGAVTPGFFRTFQSPVLQGREFSASDALPVAVVNESFVKAHFPAGTAIGKNIRTVNASSTSPWLTIVGIVPDLHMQGLGNTNRSSAGFYIPIAQSAGSNFVCIALRTRNEPMEIARHVRAAVASLNHDLPIYNAMSMKEVIRRQSWFYSVFGNIFLGLGFSALLLALAGLYGVMSFAVTQRTREMGIRAALGARSNQLVRLVIKRGVCQLGVGLALGLLLGVMLTKPLRAFFYGDYSYHTIWMAIVMAAMAGSGLLANLIPARQVTKVDPVTALSTE